MTAPTETIGLIGLGRMGLGIARRLGRGGVGVNGYDRDAAVRSAAQAAGIGVSDSVADVVRGLTTPRTIWVMVPAGAPTEDALSELRTQLDDGDLIIDGGNSNYRDSMRRSEDLTSRGIAFLDVGTSGGLAGERDGYCIMVGGDATSVGRATSIFDLLAYEGGAGWRHVGPSGAGHFVKMVHNGIEYGMMQALAEGFALLEAKDEFALDLAAVSELWRHGSIVGSRLLDHIADALADDASLAGIRPHVADSGEGRWTVQEAVDLSVPAPVITQALLERFRSRIDDSFADRLLAAMRLQFGGHQPKSR